jgi:hypothetical protein
MSFASAEMVQQEPSAIVIEPFLVILAAMAAGFGGFADIWGAIAKDFRQHHRAGRVRGFMQVLMIDLVLAGDNAIVVGALAAGLSPEQRRKVIVIGVMAALVLRILFALIVTQLLQVIGLILVGGLLLLMGRLADVARPAPAPGLLAGLRRDRRGRAVRASAGEELCRRGPGRWPSPTSA